MAKLSFAAQVKEWADKVPEAIEAVRNDSAQEVVEIMQTPTAEGGKMRVDTGFLRASLLGSTSAMPRIDPNRKPRKRNKDETGVIYPNEGEVIEATIAGADLEDTLYFGYTAAYAGAREYGARGQPPDAFVRSAAQKWPQIVEKNVKSVRQAFGL